MARSGDNMALLAWLTSLVRATYNLLTWSKPHVTKLVGKVWKQFELVHCGHMILPLQPTIAAQRSEVIEFGLGQASEQLSWTCPPSNNT